ITVAFNDGRVEAFELVICAEGISSSTRTMVLPEQTHFRYLGAYMSFFNIPQRSEDDNWARSVSGTGGTLVTLRPGKNHETTVLTTFLREDHGFEQEDAATRKALVAKALEGRGTIAERVRSELDAVSDFWCGPMSQVQASRWAKGRFVMIGDAAYCPTPFTGEGAALALIGAYVLAGELKRSSGFEDAFSAYENLVRPHVEKSQKRLSPTVIRALHMKTQFGLTFFRLVQRLVTSRVIQRLLKPSDAKRNARVAKDFVFPRYT
ncbi:FAD-dependent monooxygenase, partial [Rhodopseudomonas palustris]